MNRIGDWSFLLGVVRYYCTHCPKNKLYYKPSKRMPEKKVFFKPEAHAGTNGISAKVSTDLMGLMGDYTVHS